MNSAKKLPQKTIERLSNYRRALLGLASDGLTHIYSHQLAQIHGITAVQVRRDLMLIGFTSSAKRGYDIAILVRHISSIIDAEKPLKVAIVGMGNLAQAVNHYFQQRNTSKLLITAAFDSDKKKIGNSFFGVMCYDIDDFAQVVRREGIEIVMLTCPGEVVGGLVESIEESMVRGVLNFTSASLIFDRGIFVENYDIITLLEKVAYFSK